jgi:hypothetical protein
MCAQFHMLALYMPFKKTCILPASRPPLATLQVLFNGITVGDVASWVDSLLVAYLLRFGASSFSRVETTTCKERQLAYTFQVGGGGAFWAVGGGALIQRMCAAEAAEAD